MTAASAATAPDWTEQALTFDCQAETLIGVLTQPAAARTESGVVIVVGGPQYRAGSHRQFVLVARALAAAGHAVLRFDCRGMGDSGGEPRDFRALEPDIGAAVDALARAAPGVRHVALFGLCDAASAALLYWHATRDARIDRLVLLNPWVRTEQGLARTQVRHYYRQRVFEPAFWSKLLRGRVALGAASGLLRSLRAALRPAAAGPDGNEQHAASHYVARMAAAWRAFDGAILLLLSGDDYTAKEFLDLAARDSDWQQALRHPALSRRELPDADHTFSDAADGRLVEQYTAQWLAATGAPPRLAERSRGD